MASNTIIDLPIKYHCYIVIINKCDELPVGRLIFILQNIPFLLCYLCTKGILYFGHIHSCWEESTVISNVYWHKCLSLKGINWLIPVSRAPESSELKQITVAENLSWCLFARGQHCICAIQIDFCISVLKCSGKMQF